MCKVTESASNFTFSGFFLCVPSYRTPISTAQQSHVNTVLANHVLPSCAWSNDLRVSWNTPPAFQNLPRSNYNQMQSVCVCVQEGCRHIWNLACSFLSHELWLLVPPWLSPIHTHMDRPSPPPAHVWVIWCKQTFQGEIFYPRAVFMWAVSEEYAQRQSKTDQQSFLIKICSVWGHQRTFRHSAGILKVYGIFIWESFVPTIEVDTIADQR